MTTAKRTAKKSRGAKAARRALPLYFTFGNHMHWVDMQWLWGYHVLPGCVRDMLHLIKETGAKGNVNFDGIGYEKMAAECPEALADLRAAVKRGDVEPVGCSYGQPYGLFQGGESNIRQFTYGVRSVMRLLGVRPRSFWEEEFYFYPQLPQVLKGCGFTGACLYFQWTWHTPEVPKEPTSLIMWEGIDGTRLPTLPRNELNLHQWPEDFEGVLDRVAAMPEEALTPAIVQWLELMPSKDWMCRSEVLLPRLKELMGDMRFEVRARTVAGLIGELGKEAEREKGTVPVHAYSMDDVWHGMTLGKNGDRHPRECWYTELTIRSAEGLAATASLFGRPYASWDVYPLWELEEAWRELLAAQHHDNHECEGLCGFVGYHQLAKARRLAWEAAGRSTWLALQRMGLERRGVLITNPRGWSARTKYSRGDQVAVVPAFGFAGLAARGPSTKRTPVRVTKEKGRIVLSRGTMRCEVDESSGAITSITTRDAGTVEGSIMTLRLGEGTGTRRKPNVSVEHSDRGPEVGIWRRVKGGILGARVCLADGIDAVDVSASLTPHGMDSVRPDPGFTGAAKAACEFARPRTRVVCDGPFSAEETRTGSMGRRKYPSGDWMTSPQWFEEVRGAFTSRSFVNMEFQGGSGLMICHNGSPQWFHDKNGVQVILTAYDPWDEARYNAMQRDFEFRLVPHRGLDAAECARLATDFVVEAQPPLTALDAQPVGGGTADGVEADIPATFGPLEVVGAPNVLAHAFFRESMKNGEHLPDWAGHRMFEESDGACDHPFVIRLVEWNGEPARVRLKLAGKVAMAAKTNLMGEVEEGTKASRHRGIEAGTGWLKVRHPVAPPWWGKDRSGKAVTFRGKAITWSEVEFDMRPREIATIYADMVIGRKAFRNLDAKRKVWATVHKTKASPTRKRGKTTPR